MSDSKSRLGALACVVGLALLFYGVGLEASLLNPPLRFGDEWVARTLGGTMILWGIGFSAGGWPGSILGPLAAWGARLFCGALVAGTNMIVVANSAVPEGFIELEYVLPLELAGRVTLWSQGWLDVLVLGGEAYLRPVAPWVPVAVAAAVVCGIQVSLRRQRRVGVRALLVVPVTTAGLVLAVWFWRRALGPCWFACSPVDPIARALPFLAAAGVDAFLVFIVVRGRSDGIRVAG